MSYGPQASREYLKSAVMTATPEQLHLMLLDGAIRFSARGLEAIQEKDIEAAFNALERAQRIVTELASGLRRDVNPEVVDRMTSLYAFIFRRLVDGTMQRDPAAIEEALRILRHQRETWVLLIEKLNTAAAAEQGANSPHQDADATDTAGDAATSQGTRFVAEG